MTWVELVGMGSTVAAGCAAVVLTHRWHGRWSGDHAGSGPQKHHQGAPSRIGGLPLALGLALGALLLHRNNDASIAQAGSTLAVWLLCALPVWLLGLADDVTKRIRPRARMAGAALSAALAAAATGVVVQRTGISPLDGWLAAAPWGVLLLALPLTLLLVCGFTNAMNIVDGLNGLAGGLSLVMLAGTGLTAFYLHDAVVLQLCQVLAACVAGFVLLNFPRGCLFLGDGGAYLIGFALVQIWMLLVLRNPQLAPVSVLALAFWPTMETLFSIYRRRFRGRKGVAMRADRLHLHSLLYRRRTLPWVQAQVLHAPRWAANALAATILVATSVVPVALAARWGASSAPASLAIVALAALGYVLWFRRLAVKPGRAGRKLGPVQLQHQPQHHPLPHALHVLPRAQRPGDALPEPWADAA